MKTYLDIKQQWYLAVLFWIREANLALFVLRSGMCCTPWKILTEPYYKMSVHTFCVGFSNAFNIGLTAPTEINGRSNININESRIRAVLSVFEKTEQKTKKNPTLRLQEL